MHRFSQNVLALALLAPGLWSSGQIAEAAPACVQHGTTKSGNSIALSGTFVMPLEYGLPNFGESPNTDAKVRPMILKLDNPLSVDRSEDPGEKQPVIVVKEVQIAPRDNDLHKSWVGRHVVVRGYLYARDNYHQSREVVISSGTMRLGGHIVCDGSEVPLTR